MSWLSDFISGGKDPSKEAMNYLNQIPGAVNPYYQPYIDQGQASGKDLSGRYGQMLNDPGQLFSDLGKGYKESPGYKFKLKQALGASGNAQAAGGMAGSPQHEQLNMQLANDIASQDFNDYMKNILGLYGEGISGEQGEAERGYNASTGYGDILGQKLGSQAQYGFAGQAGKNANQSQLFQNIFKALSTAGGFALGGPLGGAAGSSLNLLPNRSYG